MSRKISPDTSQSRQIRIIDETPELIVVDKPARLQVHPSKPDGSFTLWHALKEILAFEQVNGGQISIINRLDRETSGLTLVAKTPAAARRFSTLMEQRRIHKEYLAIVWGWPERDQFDVDAPLCREGAHDPFRIWLKQGIHPKGSPARTRFIVQERFALATSNGDHFALVRAYPETGRMHQIRVHLAHLGHPIVGDKIYGPDEGLYLEFIETGWTPSLERHLLLPRHALHSAAMRIQTDLWQHEWESPLAEDLSRWMAGT